MNNVWRDMEGKDHSLYKVVSLGNKKKPIFQLSAYLLGSCEQTVSRVGPRYNCSFKPKGRCLNTGKIVLDFICTNNQFHRDISREYANLAHRTPTL